MKPLAGTFLVSDGTIMEHNLWASGLFGGLMMFGGPEMMKQANLAETLGYPRAARGVRVLAWMTLGISPVLGLALIRGWV